MFRFVLYLLVFFTLPIHPHIARASDQARRLVALLDYLSTDYRNAVKDGKTLNRDEYVEMQEFAKRSLEIFGRLKDTGNPNKAAIGFSLKSLAEQIDDKAAPKVVEELAQRIKNQVVIGYRIVPYPQQLPTLATGKTIYLRNCAVCHGESGRGDGPVGKTMNPKQPPPANFTDPERMAGLTPFRVFNAATFGIEGTAMPSFNALPKAQRWQVAFYVFALRFSAESAKAGGQLLREKKAPADLTSVATLATNSDKQLLEKLKPHVAGPSEAHAGLAYLRRGILEQKSADPLIIARTRIDEAAALYAEGQKDAAYQKAVDAYLDGFELAEPALFAKDASFGRGLEAEFTRFRIALKQEAALEEIQKRRRDISAKIEEAEKIVGKSSPFSGYYAFINSALIILREGLEAALILAAVLAMLRVMGATQAIRYIHLGWLLALGAGLLTWLVTETVLTVNGRHRESMEGFISVFAAVVLFYVGYWLHTRSEAKKWQAFIRAKVEHLVSSKRIFALVGLSFFAVYREALEVILFYQALWLQNENNHAPIIWGFAGGVGALVLATFAIFKLGLKLPLKYFFGATGTLLYILAFIFAGNGVKELQAALWLPTTPIGFSWQIPFLGIYPTVETLAAQMAMLLAFTATWFWLSSEAQRAA